VGKFWQEVSNAEWMADVGVPLAATLLAVLAGFLSLRRQLTHDRELALAQRRSEVAHRLGSEVLRAVGLMDGRIPNKYQTAPDWEGFRIVRLAVNEASIVLPRHPALEHVWLGAVDLVRAWRSCNESREALALNGILLEEREVAGALMETIYPLTKALRNAGEELIRWTGHLPLPGGEVWPLPHVPKGRGNREAAERWTDYYANLYERKAREMHRLLEIRRSEEATREVLRGNRHRPRP